MHFFRSIDTGPFAQNTLLSADMMKGTSLSNHLLFSAPSGRPPKNNHFPALQILLGSRKQDQKMLRLETKLGTYYIRFCGCYWWNKRRAGMKRTLICLLCSSGLTLLWQGQLGKRMDLGWLARKKDKGRIFDKCSGSGGLQTHLKKKKGILYICAIKKICLQEILKLFTDVIPQ